MKKKTKTPKRKSGRRSSRRSSSRRGQGREAPAPRATSQPIHFHTLPPELLEGVVAVHLIGAGGNGSQMLTGLARLHLALRSLGHEGLHVTLYDPDTVSETNIGRQLFSPADIGHHKATVLVNRVNNFFGLDWLHVPDAWPRPSGERSPSIVITCTDTRSSRRTVHNELVRRRSTRTMYWLDLGNRDTTGQVIMGQLPDRPTNDPDEQPRQLPMVTEIFPDILNSKIKDDNAPSCSLAEALRHQDLFVNQAVTTWGLHLLWTFFRKGHIRHHGYFINLESGHVRPVPVPPPQPKPIAQAA